MEPPIFRLLRFCLFLQLVNLVFLQLVNLVFLQQVNRPEDSCQNFLKRNL